METNELINLESTLNTFIENYYNKVNAINAQQVYYEFDSKWFKTVDFDKDIISKYGKAIVSYSSALFILQNTNEHEISNLAELISEYDNNTNTKFQFSVKEILYWNLGLCWHKLGKLYDNYAVDAFKKFIYSLFSRVEKAFCPKNVYSFRRINDYLFSQLRDSKLNIVSPTKFNDPFDCPIIELLCSDEGVASLIRQAYLNCVKVSCFVSNYKLPTPEGFYTHYANEIIHCKKHQNDVDEFLNPLMWAHYADSHNGVCIKYCFSESVFNLNNNYGKISLFQDVKYSDEDLIAYSNKDKISIEDAFFLKGRQWEYENEMRLIHFDINGEKEYDVIDIPNCVEAIYFGLKCMDKNKKEIQNIMKNRKCIVKNISGQVIFEQEVQFYQIIMDKEHFGRIKAVKIGNEN